MFLEQQRIQDRLHGFLIGLHDAYGPHPSNLIAQGPLSSITRAYQTIAQEERLRGTSAFALPQPSEALASAEESRTRIRTNNDIVLFTHCNREEHDVMGCF